MAVRDVASPVCRARRTTRRPESQAQTFAYERAAQCRVHLLIYQCQQRLEIEDLSKKT